MDKEIETPLVSIVCDTYNHVNYIRQCLDGFLMQETNFPIEILVHDDASTDGTADIVKEYEARYPDLIKPIYQTENQYSKGVKVSIRYQYSRAKGKYIALCEGDDYWIDPLKLQKQVDFLEKHVGYSMCFTNAIQHYEDGLVEDTYFNDSTFLERDYEGLELFRNWLVPTASIVCRSEIFYTELYRKATANPYFVFGDILIVLSCALMGKVRGSSDATCVYRRTAQGALARQNSTWQSQMSYVRHIEEIPKVFGQDFLNDSKMIIVSQYCFLLAQALKQKNIFRATRFLLASLGVSVKQTLIVCLKKCF